jgi:hypothetical protein
MHLCVRRWIVVSNSAGMTVESGGKRSLILTHSIYRGRPESSA